jgi:hypothetical protein
MRYFLDERRISKCTPSCKAGLVWGFAPAHSVCNIHLDVCPHFGIEIILALFEKP